MKPKNILKITSFLLFTVICFSSYGQAKTYGTKNIGQWSLEKFPLHYSVSPAKKINTKNPKSGKLESYEEFNSLGKNEGLQMFLSPDGINPLSANYIYKGVTVYSVTFFPGTSRAQTIMSFNLNSDFDGFQVRRASKIGGGYTEEIEKYNDGVLVELNGVKISPAAIVYKDSLLHGKFKFYPKENFFTIDGVADNGMLRSIKQVIERTSHIREIIFLADSFLVRRNSELGEGLVQNTYPLRNRPLVTNSSYACTKYGNLNGYPYLYFTNNFDVEYLIKSLQLYYPTPLETKVDFLNGLLDGNFRFRHYLTSYDVYNGKYLDVYGVAENGRLLNLKIHSFEYDPNSNELLSEKIFEYEFKDSKIIQRDFVPRVSAQPLATKTVDIHYEVLLTNIDSLGGKYSFYERSQDGSIFKIPSNRRASILGDKHGYLYFSAETFDIQNFLHIITTKRPKPIIKKMMFQNGILTGDLEFKQDGVHYKGSLSDGLLTELEMVFDVPQSKKITNIWVKYDKVIYSIKANELLIEYFKENELNKLHTETHNISKLLKLTNSSDLINYEGFCYFKNELELSKIFLGLKFFQK